MQSRIFGKYKYEDIEYSKNVIFAGDLKFPNGIFDLYNKLMRIKDDYDVIQCCDGVYSLFSVCLSGKKPFFLRLGLSMEDFFKEYPLDI